MTVYGKSIILKAAPGRVAGGAGRGYRMVYCARCGYRNHFDTFSWGGHKALRCKRPSCRRLIARDGTVADTRAELREAEVTDGPSSGRTPDGGTDDFLHGTRNRRYAR